jgi:hypothetical protein
LRRLPLVFDSHYPGVRIPKQPIERRSPRHEPTCSNPEPTRRR